MAKAKAVLKGTREEALALQEQNGVQAQHSGLWFHSSKEKKTELTEYGEPTFFSRSPHGWTGWGGAHANDPILVAAVVAPLSPDSVLRAPFVSGGDKDGFENKLPLVGWWLVLANSDIDKVMIVDQYLQSAADKVKSYSEEEAYIALRGQTVKQTQDAEAKRVEMLEKAKAAQKKK